jgi:hypothetical protein
VLPPKGKADDKPVATDDARTNLSVEVAEFPLKPVYLPHASLRHHLYVYPLAADLRPCGANVRNISCRVELLDRDVRDVPCAAPRHKYCFHFCCLHA